MVLKYITIQSLGVVDHFKYDFQDSLNIVKSRYADEILYAIQFVLGHRISSLPKHRVREDTQIAARLCVTEREYQIVIKKEAGQKNLCLRAYDENGNDATKDYLYLTSHCIEQDISDVFCGEYTKEGTT